MLVETTEETELSILMDIAAQLKRIADALEANELPPKDPFAQQLKAFFYGK